jgi:hypothetical protein
LILINDERRLYVVDATTLKGDGWTATVGPGWTVQPGPRPGSFRVVRQ